MPVVAVVMLAVFISFFAMDSFRVSNTKEFSDFSGVRDGATGAMIPPRGVMAQNISGINNFNETSDKDERETIETALIRTCRTISTLSHFNNCGNWNQSTAIWTFVGLGVSGSIDGVFTGTTSATFSCANKDEYARSIMQASIPREYVINKGYRYNFGGLDDTFTDPCGYIDIVGRQ